MTTKDAITKAAELFAEWKEGDKFEFEQHANFENWYPCGPDEVYAMLLGDTRVRIKPRPKKVLRPAWEILRVASQNGLVRTNPHSGAITIEFPTGKFLLSDFFVDNHADWRNAPDWFFTTEEPNR